MRKHMETYQKRLKKLWKDVEYVEASHRKFEDDLIDAIRKKHEPKIQYLIKNRDHIIKWGLVVNERRKLVPK